MVLRRALLPLVLILLLGASLTAKIVRYNAHLGNGRDIAETQIATALGEQGFATLDSVDLVTGGVVRALRFQAPGCARPVMVVVLSGSAEGDDLLRQFTPPGVYKMTFVYGGRESKSPPLVRFLMMETIRAIGRAVGLPMASPQPFLGIANPLDCPIRPRWPALW
jgi:hypothetical protein